MQGIWWLLACVIAGAGAARAESPGEDQMRFVLRWAEPARARIDDTVPLIVAFLRRDDVDGVPGLSLADAVLWLRVETAGRGLEPLQRLLASDLDGNLAISRAEAETVARIAASQPLQSAAGPVLPDRDQRATLARRLADAVMKADGDGDGVVSEGEIRAAAIRPAEPAAFTAKRLAGQDAARILQWADADGDGNAAPDEIAAGVRAVLVALDSDGDGRVTGPEFAAAK